MCNSKVALGASPKPDSVSNLTSGLKIIEQLTNDLHSLLMKQIIIMTHVFYEDSIIILRC